MDGLDRRAEDSVSRAAALAVLAIATAVAAFLRFDGLGLPSYWLDEVLGQVVVERAPAIPWWQWLTGVHPQHGPLYYALQWLASALRDDEWGGRFFAALFGVGTVPLLWMTARKNVVASCVAAALLAISPLAVYYSREARPYALLVLLVTIAMFAILRRAPALAAVALVLMLYTSVAAAPAVAAVACAAFAAWFFERGSQKPLLIIAGVALAVLASFPLLYRTTTAEPPGSPFPGLTLSLADAIVRGLSVTALASQDAGRTAYVVLVLAIAGAVMLLRRDRSFGAMVLSMVIVPVVVSVIALFARNHFFGIRYVIAALPAYLLLAAFGIAAIASMVKLRALTFVTAIAFVAVIAVQSWPAARSEAFRKLDWRGIAQTIHRYAHPGDLVLMAEPWSGLVLPHYLNRLPPKVRALQISDVPLAEVAVQEHPAAWLVSGGFNPDVRVREWMCRFPVVLAGARENFRMHYTSRSGGRFLGERASVAEWRAVSAALGENVMLQMTQQEELFLGEGWSAAEGAGGDSFRWAMGDRATVFVPRFGPANRALRMRVSPLDHPSLPPQTMRVELNGVALQTFTLVRAQELTIHTSASAWRDGLNTLTFHFGRANAPVDLDPSNLDSRKLAVSFDWIAIGDSGSPVSAIAVRLSPPLLEPNDPTDTRFPPNQLDRAAVLQLLGRIGLDPATTWTQLERREVRLEDLLDTVAYGNDCMDDTTFARTMFTLLIGRAPSESEVKSLANVRRDRVANRISRFEEFLLGVRRP